MKKLSILLAIMSMGLMLVGCNDTSTSLNSQKTLNESGAIPNEEENKIGVEAAKIIVLKHCGLDETQAKFTEATLDKDDSKLKYDFEFTVGDFEYDYQVDAYSGEIISSSMDTIKG